MPPRVESTSSRRILGEALKLFSRKGYAATAVREICEAAGITKPTLYHFFGSKEGVYRALVDGTLERHRGAVEAALESGGSLRDRLKRVARGYFEATRRDPELIRFIVGLVHNPSRSAPGTDFTEYYDAFVALVARALEDGVASGEVAPGPAEARLLVFFGALGEALCGSLICGRPELTDRLADALVDTILGGWLPRPQPC
jgi:AcrR family transcriptional regulator